MVNIALKQLGTILAVEEQRISNYWCSLRTLRKDSHCQFLASARYLSCSKFNKKVVCEWQYKILSWQNILLVRFLFFSFLFTHVFIYPAIILIVPENFMCLPDLNQIHLTQAFLRHRLNHLMHSGIRILFLYCPYITIATYCLDANLNSCSFHQSC